MAKKRHYEYVNAAYCQVGLMACCKCGQKIVEGDYRYHETEHAYVPCHRACCEDDPKWVQLDNERTQNKERARAYRQACREFVAKWGVPDEEDFVHIPED